MPLKVAIIKEPSGAPKGSGVYTAFLQTMDELRRCDDVDVQVNRIGPGVDVIHAHTTMWRYLLASVRHHDRLIVSAHEVPDTYLGSFVFDRLCHLAARHWLRFVYDRARLVVAVSPYTKEDLERLGVAAEIVVLCNCVDRRRFKPDPDARARLRAKYGLSPDAFVVVNAAQVQPRKGPELFVDAARLTPEAQFVWVGGRPFGRLSADYDRLTRLMSEAPANVRFVGQVPYEEMPGHYAMADACFFPSVQECFGYTIVEAAAAGLPVIVRDNPAYDGYLFDHCLRASTPERAAGLIDRLRTDEAFMTARRAHTETLAGLYDLAGYTERLVELYRRVAAEAATPARRRGRAAFGAAHG